MSGILRLESLTKGNTLKQGDKTPLKYRLFDADGDTLNIAGKSAKVRLVYPDFLTIGYEKDGLTVAQDDTVTFTIDGVIPSRIYHVEIIVDGQFIFPSRSDESKFTVDKSSLGTEANIIEIVGVDQIVSKVIDGLDSGALNVQPADGSITSVKLAQNAVERANIKDSAVGNSKLALRSVTGDKIGIEQITSENIALQGIERKNIKDKAIGNAQIVDNAVSGNKIIDGAIVSEKLADNAITNSKISDNSITYNKTGFLKLVEPINLFDGYFTNFNLAGSGVLTFVKDPSTEHYGAILKINPGKTYSVATNPDYSGTIKVATSTQLVDGGQLDGNFTSNDTVSAGAQRVFTAGENDQYLYVDLYNEGFLKVVESVNPVIPFIGEKYPIFLSNKEVSQIVWFGDSISCLRNLPHRVENAIGDKVFDVSIAGSTGSTHSGGLAYDGTSFVGLVDAVINNDWTRVDESVALRNHWKNDENIATLKTVDFNTIDKVVLFYGTNDFRGSNNSLETYRSGMVSSIEKLINAYPHLQFYLVTPMYRTDWDTVNTHGLTLKEYINETLEIAKRYAFPVLNAFESVGINDLNSGYYLNEDGLHQNDSGDELLGEKLSKFLMSDRSDEFVSKADKVVINNLVKNGDFSDGSLGWKEHQGGEIEVVDFRLKVNTSTASYSGTSQAVNANYDIGDILYTNITVDNPNDHAIELNLQYTNASRLTQISPTFNGVVSTVQTATRSITNFTYYITKSHSNDEYSFFIDNVILINLTETFGAGNEPTKEEMDELFKVTGYIDGEYALNNKEMLIWTLALIRRNKNAIVALGGA